MKCRTFSTRSERLTRLTAGVGFRIVVVTPAGIAWQTCLAPGCKVLTIIWKYGVNVSLKHWQIHIETFLMYPLLPIRW